ncbi:DUF4326 domain-containing protein [Vibrio crassostreae]|uniref:DUF4326 domain-containing protein n=1 Tax=Vibrio crassostreae TaxID=246167 RepID=UPI001B31651F|nr:DUF4326 domain-containing protein [Vibrio crassostreae]
MEVNISKFKLYIHAAKYFSNVDGLLHLINKLVGEREFNVEINNNSWLKEQVAAKEISFGDFSKEEADGILIIDNQHNSEKKQIAECKKLGTPTRIVTLLLAGLSNKKKGEPYDVFIGRGSIYGNPYSVTEIGSRDEVIRMHEYDFERELLNKCEEIKSSFEAMEGVTLGCYCSPMKCHGEVYVRYINSNSWSKIKNFS